MATMNITEFNVKNKSLEELKKINCENPITDWGHSVGIAALNDEFDKVKWIIETGGKDCVTYQAGLCANGEILQWLQDNDLVIPR